MTRIRAVTKTQVLNNGVAAVCIDLATIDLPSLVYVHVRPVDSGSSSCATNAIAN